MDEERFDGISRAIGKLVDRRNVIAMLLLAASSAQTTKGVDAVRKSRRARRKHTRSEDKRAQVDAAKKKPKAKPCKKNKDCTLGQSCCSQGKKDGVCVDFQDDDEHCGSCFAACGVGKICLNGQCQCPDGQVECDGVCGTSCGCPGSQISCGGICVDPASNADHCGNCDNTCVPGQTCVEGQCDCGSGEIPCDGACRPHCGSGVCIDFATNPNHCGACGHHCTGGRICIGGDCACAPGLNVCSGECVNLHCDANNCGTCGNSCSAGDVCKLGVCGSSGDGYSVVEVPAAQIWTDSGIDLALGQQVTVEATGLVHIAGSDPGASPAGIPPYLGVEPGYVFLDANSPAYSLIGRIASSSPFHIGVDDVFTAPVAGRLELAVNDSYFPDNNGSFKVCIDTSPGGTQNGGAALR